MPFDGTGFPRVLTEIEARDLAVLKRARHRIRYRWMWGKGHIETMPVFWRHCALSALSPRYAESPSSRLRAQLPPGWGAVHRYNDDPATTHADILGLFDRAIAELESGE
jgi:hypothetical protein